MLCCRGGGRPPQGRRLKMFRFFLSIPALPLGNRSGRGIFFNRRNPTSQWISPNDIGLNFSDWLDTFSRRVPDGAFLNRDENNNFRGMLYRHRSRRRTNNRRNQRRRF